MLLKLRRSKPTHWPWLLVMILCLTASTSLAADDDSGLDALVSLLGEVDDGDFQLDLLKGIRDGLKGRKKVPMPKGWIEVYRKLRTSKRADVRAESRSLALTFGDPAARAQLAVLMMKEETPLAERQGALQTLLAHGSKNQMPILLQALLGDPAMRGHALRGLAAYDDRKTPERILKCYGTLTASQKQDAVSTLASRPEYARALLDAVEQEHIPRRDLSAFIARQIDNFNDAALRARLREVWGNVQEQSADKKELVAKYRAVLTPKFVGEGDVQNGRLLFKKTCHQCHRLFGEGGEIGPDLTGANRANLDYVLENVLTPSTAIAKDYQLKVIITTDGRVVNGIIKETSQNALVVLTANDHVTIPREDIDEMSESPVSMMPDGLWAKLTNEEVRDLVKYLAAETQVPLPEGASE